MKKWVLFDLDGTLTDPMIGITSAVKYALSKYGIEVQYLKELTPFIGPPLLDSFMEYYGFSEEQAKEAIGYYREYYGPKGLYENEVYPDIKKMLVHLEQVGFDLAVASSKPTEYVDRILRHFGLREHFVLVVGSEFDGRRIKKEDVIDYVIRRAQIRPGQAIMVGDRKHDILGAKACGVESIGVSYGYGSREELEEYGADHVVDSVGELEEVIFKILTRDQKASPGIRSWSRNDPPSEAEVFGGSYSFAMVGCGSKAERFYQANRFGKQIDLIAVCGKTMEEALEFAARKGRLLCFDDIHDLASFEAVEAVYVSSDLKERAKTVITLLNAGKHVLVEAPMAQNKEDAAKMYQTARENHVILMEAVPSIYTPAFQKMLPYMESLGKIRHASLHNCHNNVGYGSWKRGIVTKDFNPEYSGGALMEMGACPVSFMIQLFGKPNVVHGAGIRLSNGLDVTGTILMGYEDMVGEVIYSMISDSAMPSQVQGEEGSMLIREIENIKDLRISRRKVDQSIHFEQSDNIMNYVTNAFVRMIRTGIGMEDAEKVSIACLEVLEEAGKTLGR